MGWIATPQCYYSPGTNQAAAGNAQMFYISEAKRLARRGKLIEMMGLVQERVEEGTVDDPKAFLDVVGVQNVRGGCISVLQSRRLPYVLEFCVALSDMGISAREYLGNHGLNLIVSECARLLEERRLEDCIRALEKLAKCGFAVKNLVKPTSCMEVCAKTRKVGWALRYANLLPNLRQSYNMIMQKFRDEGDLNSVFEVFKALKDAGISPDEYSYCILIDACGRCGQPAKAAAIFEELLEADSGLNVYVCNSMMNACADNIQDVMKLYRQMQCSGIAADLTTYNIVLKACRLSKQPSVALRLYEELQEKGLELSVMTYGTLIQIFGEAKMLQQAFKIKQDMDEANVKLNVVTWTSLIGACSAAGLVDKAFQVFQEMVLSGCIPNAFTYNFLLSACVEAGQFDRAQSLFNEWKTSGKILPNGMDNLDFEPVRLDSLAYNTMLRACMNSTESMESLIQEMRIFGLKPDKRSWSILINAYAGNKDKQGAIEAFKRMENCGVKADVVTYTAVIKACVNAQDVSEALRFFDTLKAAGISPNSVTYKTLLRARRFGDLNNTRKLLAIYEEMRENRCPPNERILKSLIEDWAENVIKGKLTSQPGNEIFKEYAKTILRKVSVSKSPTENFTVDLQGLSKAEARAAVLIVLRMIKEEHAKLPLEEDLIVVTGPSRQNEGKNVLQNVVTQVLETQLSLPVSNLEDAAALDSEGSVTVRKPVTLGRLKVSKQALNEWIRRKASPSSTLG